MLLRGERIADVLRCAVTLCIATGFDLLAKDWPACVPSAADRCLRLGCHKFLTCRLVNGEASIRVTRAGTTWERGKIKRALRMWALTPGGTGLC